MSRASGSTRQKLEPPDEREAAAPEHAAELVEAPASEPMLAEAAADESPASRSLWDHAPAESEPAVASMTVPPHSRR